MMELLSQPLGGTVRMSGESNASSSNVLAFCKELQVIATRHLETNEVVSKGCTLGLMPISPRLAMQSRGIAFIGDAVTDAKHADSAARRCESTGLYCKTWLQVVAA